MKRIQIYLCAVIIAFVAVSCNNRAIDESAGQDQIITLTLSTTSDKPEVTKATTKAPGQDAFNENRVDRVDIFFYEGENCLFYPDASQLTFENNKVTIKIPEATAFSLFSKTCKIYILANCNLDRTALENKTLTNLKNLEMVNAEDFNGVTPKLQANFLMDGSVDVNMNANVNNLGKVELKRAASKIVVEIGEAEVIGYTPGEATLTLLNYINKTTIGDGTLYNALPGDFMKSPHRVIGDLSEVGTHKADPLYSYSNDWETDETRESYVMLAIPWTSSLGVTRTYYYRIPFSYIKATGNVDANKFRLRRNYIYQFLVNVNVLGGLDPENAVELYPNFEVKDWTDKTIDVSMLAYDFLVVYKRNVEMHNVTTFKVEYASSSPIKITGLEAHCSEYAASGTVSQKNYVIGNPEFPTVTINADNTFTIQSSIPTNYVPKTITFTVQNNSLLKQKVTVVCFPSKYITAQYSTNTPYEAGSNLGGGTNNPNGDTGQQNFNLFTITTSVLSLTDVMPEGQPYFAIPITIGDPTFDAGGGYRQTGTDFNSNFMMSPQFVVASQRGISSQHLYEDAVARCKGFQEAPYPRGSWRVPTAAELAYGNMLQDDPNSAVKGLFVTGDNTWWTSYKPWGFNFGSNILVNASTTYYIRCVHDTWKD